MIKVIINYGLQIYIGCLVISVLCCLFCCDCIGTWLSSQLVPRGKRQLRTQCWLTRQLRHVSLVFTPTHTLKFACSDNIFHTYTFYSVYSMTAIYKNNKLLEKGQFSVQLHDRSIFPIIYFIHFIQSIQGLQYIKTISWQKMVSFQFKLHDIGAF